MTTFVLRRIATAAAVLLFTVVFLTVITRVLPGDPATTILGPRATPELIAEVRADLHLDLSPLAQLMATFADLLRGDWGTEWSSREPVWDLLGRSLPSTLILAVTSLVLAVLLGIPLGVWSAARPGSWADRLTGVLSVSLMSVPAYVVALILLLVFVQQLQILPGIGEGSLADPLDYASHLVLPTFALAVGWGGYLSRLVRSSMLEQLASEHVRNARSLGLRERTVLSRYALRGALVPVVAIVGSALGYLVAGTIVIEEIFSRPGLGALLVDSVRNREWAVVRACALVFAVIFVAGNAAAEIGVRALDPRVELGKEAA
jgi:peptide/nickel transport system permease protein